MTISALPTYFYVLERVWLELFAFQFPIGLSYRWPHSRVEFIQDQYQVLLLELEIQLQNSGSTEINERRAQVTELTEMGGKFEELLQGLRGRQAALMVK